VCRITAERCGFSWLMTWNIPADRMAMSKRRGFFVTNRRCYTVMGRNREQSCIGGLINRDRHICIKWKPAKVRSWRLVVGGLFQIAPIATQYPRVFLFLGLSCAV